MASEDLFHNGIKDELGDKREISEPEEVKNFKEKTPPIKKKSTIKLVVLKNRIAAGQEYILPEKAPPVKDSSTINLLLFEKKSDSAEEYILPEIIPPVEKEASASTVLAKDKINSFEENNFVEESEDVVVKSEPIWLPDGEAFPHQSQSESERENVSVSECHPNYGSLSVEDEKVILTGHNQNTINLVSEIENSKYPWILVGKLMAKNARVNANQNRQLISLKHSKQNESKQINKGIIVDNIRNSKYPLVTLRKMDIKNLPITNSDVLPNKFTACLKAATRNVDCSKSVKCPQCDYRGKFLSHLKRHMIWHPDHKRLIPPPVNPRSECTNEKLTDERLDDTKITIESGNECDVDLARMPVKQRRKEGSTRLIDEKLDEAKMKPSTMKLGRRAMKAKQSNERDLEEGRPMKRRRKPTNKKQIEEKLDEVMMEPLKLRKRCMKEKQIVEGLHEEETVGERVNECNLNFERKRVKHKRKPANKKQIDKRLDEAETTTESDNECDLNFASESECDFDLAGDSDTDSNCEDLHEDGDVALQFGAPTKEFTWVNVEKFSPNNYAFDSSKCGISEDCNFREGGRESDYFQFLFDDIMNHVITETNKYLNFILRRDKLSSYSKIHQRYAVTVNELYVFIGLTLLMPHTEKHRLIDYWNSDPLFETPVFSKYMPWDRYHLLMRLLHFTDNYQAVDNDLLSKIRPILSKLRRRFHHCFSPDQRLALNESLVLKGHLIFKPDIPSNRCHLWIKMFVLRDCKTGVVIDLVAYAGKDVAVSSSDPHGFSGVVVKAMMERFMDKGHILYTNNLCTSPALSLYLHKRKTGSCGTVRTNKNRMAKFCARGRRRACELLKSGPLLAIKWTDKQEVYMLSTVHSGCMVFSQRNDRVTSEQNLKPDAVVDHTRNMRLVGKSDMHVGAFQCVRHAIKWYKKLFFHLVDLTLRNAFYLYRMKTGRKVTLVQFSKAVILQILEKYAVMRKSIPEHPSRVVSERLSSRHYIVKHNLQKLPETESRHVGQRACYVCVHTQRRKKKRKKVSTWCQQCGVALCYSCFVDYHTLSKF